MTHTETTDAQLLARFRTGDDSALEPLFLRYEGPVFRFLYGVLKDHHAAEDALQETFVQAIRRAETVARRLSGGGGQQRHTDRPCCMPARQARAGAGGGRGPSRSRGGFAGRYHRVVRADEARTVRELLDRLPGRTAYVIAVARLRRKRSSARR